MRRRSPFVFAALLLFALALLFQSPAPATAQKPSGKCNGCYKRFDRCMNGGEPETCYAQLVECLLANGCPAPPAR